MTASSLVIEPMGDRHADAVQAIDELVYGNPWSDHTWRRELSAADRHHIVARAGGEVVGHAGLLYVLDEVHITTVAVHPDRGGQGIGTSLVSALMDAARLHSSTAATLEVRSADRRTQRIYARFGFRPVGLRRAYYSKPADDAIVMWLHDLDGEEAAVRLERVRREVLGVPEGEVGR